MGQQGQHWQHGHVGGIDPTGSHQFCKVAAQSSRCLPQLAPGNRATGVLGRQMMGCRKQTVSPGTSLGIPGSAMGSHCLSGSCPGLCAVPPSAIWSNSQALVPTPARGKAAGCEAGSGTPGAVLSHPNYSRVTHLPQLQDLLCCYFLGVPGLGWLGGGYFDHRQLHSSYLCFPSFQATVTLLDPTGS